MEAAVTGRARVFFSFRSPFSWMALTRLHAAMPGARGDLEFVPFWNPDAATAAALAEAGARFHYVEMSKAKHLYILQDTKRQAQRLGLTLAWPVDVDPWWELPHLGWLKARRLGRASEFYDAIVEARWQRGENICEPAVVAAAAVSAGLDAGAITGAVDDDEIRAEGVACLAAAYADDIFGVPYFRIGRDRYWGLDRIDAFVQAVHGERASRAADGDPLIGVPERLRDAIGGYDTDSAGGCG